MPAKAGIQTWPRVDASGARGPADLLAPHHGSDLSEEALFPTVRYISRM